MTAPPRFASWLLDATLPAADADAIVGDLFEECREHVVPRRGSVVARCWFYWQVARSLAPLFFRSWERASVTRASVAIVAAAIVSTVPATLLLALRTFTLQQVPLKTTAEMSGAFAAVLVLLVLATTAASIALGLRMLKTTRGYSVDRDDVRRSIR